jgi:hypothetical protein
MKRFAAFGLVVLMSALVAVAHGGPRPDPTGSFDKLSPDDQKVARAIFEAQKPAAPKALTLDQLAYRKLYDRKGWPSIYKDLRMQGLVREKSLQQAIEAAAQR